VGIVTLTTRNSITASPLADLISAILKFSSVSVSETTIRYVRSSSHVFVAEAGRPHCSTLWRSIANGNVRTIVTGPSPAWRIPVPAGYSTSLTVRRTTLPGSRAGVGEAIGVCLAVGAVVGDASPSVVPGPAHADIRIATATRLPLMRDMLADTGIRVMRVVSRELIRAAELAVRRG
jgi:hypothetical protein